MKNVIQRHQYDNAAEIIKAAILKSQYEASKDINRIQLGLYFGIGKFLSEKLVMQNGAQTPCSQLVINYNQICLD